MYIMWSQSAKHNAEKHIFVHPKMFYYYWLIIFIIYHSYFQVKSCLCKINVVSLLHSVELLILFHHTSPKIKANLEYN